MTASVKQRVGESIWPRLLMNMLVVHPPLAGRGRALARWYDRLTNRHSHKWMSDGGGSAALVRQAGFDGLRPCGDLDRGIPEAPDGAGVCVEARR